MKEEQDALRDIAEIRSMMERSSKFLSLSGLSGIMAGIYALTAAYIIHGIFLKEELPWMQLSQQSGSIMPPYIVKIIFIGVTVLILALGTAILLSNRKARKAGEKLWNASTRRMVINMAVPLVAGGVFVLMLVAKGEFAFIAPLTLLFYGIAVYSASKFTYEEMRSLGLIEIVLGLLGCWFTPYGLLFWGIGFGLLHIVYGIYMHYRYER